MENILKDSLKIQKFAEIQKSLDDLESNSSDEAISNIINLIPPNFLTQKDDLAIICQLFAYIARNNCQTKKGNAIKLFEKILDSIKLQFKNDSTFFWQIFGGILFLKLWFYEEGLIFIEDIVQRSRSDTTFTIAEYFLPEIIEKEPDFYDKELKAKFKDKLTEGYIENYKEKRKKYFKWSRNSSDYNDPLYREIETNQFRYALKTDDVDTFQKILSNSNMSVNSQISELIYESYARFPRDFYLIEFAVRYNSINIFKFLILNNADVKCASFLAITQRNYEIIHVTESMMPNEFENEVLGDSISSWNNEMVEYSINNFDLDYFEKSDVDNLHDEQILTTISDTCFASNYVFLENYLLPFLNKNPRFVDDNINEILIRCIDDHSSYFFREFLKHPKANINYHSKDEEKSILVEAIQSHNFYVIKELFKYPELDIVSPGFRNFSPFQVACSIKSNLEIIKLFCDHPKFDINWTDSRHHLSAFQFSVTKQNTYATEYLLNRYHNIERWYSTALLYFCICNDVLLTLKILLKHYIRIFGFDDEKIIQDYKKSASSFSGYKDDHLDVLKTLLHEIRENIIEHE